MMVQTSRTLSLVIASWLGVTGIPVSAVGSVQVAPEPGTALEALVSPPRGLIRQRAQHFYRMPDGTIWDGYYAQEFHRVVNRHLREFERRERGEAAPGSTIVEDRTVGTGWRFRQHRDTEAWHIFELLAKEDGELDRPESRIRGETPPPYLETADRRRWKESPPLWSSRNANDFTWDFALIDENNPDSYTRRTHGSYLRITRFWGDDQYEIEGYSMDFGRIEGIVTIPTVERHGPIVRRDQLRGTFFLWPDGSVDQPGGYTRPAWRYILADELRLSPEELAEALIDSRAEIVEWSYQRLSGRLIWQRTIHPVEFAPVRLSPKDRPAYVPPPEVGQEGPDLIMLKDGRWYRGWLVRHDEESIVFATKIGELESRLVFNPSEVQEVQSPEKTGP